MIELYWMIRDLVNTMVGQGLREESISVVNFRACSVNYTAESNKWLEVLISHDFFLLIVTLTICLPDKLEIVDGWYVCNCNDG